MGPVRWKRLVDAATRRYKALMVVLRDPAAAKQRAEDAEAARSVSHHNTFIQPRLHCKSPRPAAMALLPSHDASASCKRGLHGACDPTSRLHRLRTTLFACQAGRKEGEAGRKAEGAIDGSWVQALAACQSSELLACPSRLERKRRRAEERHALKAAKEAEERRQRQIATLTENLGLAERPADPARPGESRGACPDDARCAPSIVSVGSQKSLWLTES